MRRVLFVLVLAGCATKGASDATPSYLFVQNAQHATLSDGRLVLEDVAPRAVVFSDRPTRQAGHMTNAALLRAWTASKDSFEKDPPNATLSIFEGESVVDVVVVLRNPKQAGSRVTYDVEVIGGPESASGGPAALFIDNLAPWPVVREGMHDEPNVVIREGMHLAR